MPSSHLILCRPLLLLPLVLPSIRVFSNESTLHMRWPKSWSFSFSIIPSKEIPGLKDFCLKCYQQKDNSIKITEGFLSHGRLCLQCKSCRRCGLIPGSGRSPRGRNGNPLQYSGQDNPMDRGAWWATVHGVSKNWTRLND